VTHIVPVSSLWLALAGGLKGTYELLALFIVCWADGLWVSGTQRLGVHA